MKSKTLATANWEDLTEPQPPETLTAVEQAGVLGDIDPERVLWLNNGILVLKKFLPDELIARYSEVRAQLPEDKSLKDNFWAGWHYSTPYMVCPELRDLALNKALTDKLAFLIGEDVGLHLALTGWVSTERNYHQDTYLNPPFLWSNYLAVWMALDDIHPDSGPFEFVRGSHNWETLRREKLFNFLSPDEQADPCWPTLTQDGVARVCEEKMKAMRAEPERFIPEKSDVLVWHSNLVHRGTKANNPDLLRKSLICHYSALSKRADMPNYKQHGDGGYYFELRVPVSE